MRISIVTKVLALSFITAGALVTGSARAQDYALTVDASQTTGKVKRFWQAAVGSEHMYTVIESALPDVNLQSAYRLAHQELGIKRVRGHGILNDDVGVYREVNGVPTYNWENLDKIYDYIVEQGMDPLVELGFMPSDLASGEQTFGWYNGVPGNVTLPKDWAKWRGLISAFAAHVIERYGAERVEQWYWEVWNEPDLPRLFFEGDFDDYLRLYDETVTALRQTNPNLLVGGPSPARSDTSEGRDWISDLIDHCMAENVPIDFISWHTYPNFKADPGAIPAMHKKVQAKIDAKMAQYPGLELENLLTEWNTTFRGGASYHHEVGASFVAKTIHSLFEDQSGVKAPDAASFWVVSDIWEEQERDGLGFNSMGMLMRKHDVRKPSYLAFQMLAWMHDNQISFSGGTTASRGLNGWATIDDSQKQVQILIYDHNFVSSITADADFVDTALHSVELNVTGLPFTKAAATIQRYGVDRDHNNAYWVADAAGEPREPSEATWLQMKEAGQLKPVEAERSVTLNDGSLEIAFDQYQPGVTLFLITEEGAAVPPLLGDPEPPPNTGGVGGASGGGGQGGSAGMAGSASAGAGGTLPSPDTMAGAGGMMAAGAPPVGVPGSAGAAVDVPGPSVGGSDSAGPDIGGVASAGGAAATDDSALVQQRASSCHATPSSARSYGAGWLLALSASCALLRRRRR